MHSRCVCSLCTQLLTNSVQAVQVRLGSIPQSPSMLAFARVRDDGPASGVLHACCVISVSAKQQALVILRLSHADDGSADSQVIIALRLVV